MTQSKKANPALSVTNTRINIAENEQYKTQLTDKGD